MAKTSLTQAWALFCVEHYAGHRPWVEQSRETIEEFAVWHNSRKRRACVASKTYERLSRVLGSLEGIGESVGNLRFELAATGRAGEVSEWAHTVGLAICRLRRFQERLEEYDNEELDDGNGHVDPTRVV